MFARSILVVQVLACLVGLNRAEAVTPLPPIVERRPMQLHAHGDVRVDDYFWLREDAVMTQGADPSEQLLSVILAQNAYTDAVMAPNAALTTQIKAELKARQAARDGVPALPLVEQGYEYWSKTEAGDPAPKFFRRKVGSSTSELLIDGPALMGTHKYIHIETGQISPNGRYLPYVVDYDGDWAGKLYVRDLTNGQVLVVRENEAKSFRGYMDIGWSNDSRWIYYSCPGTAGRDSAIKRKDITDLSQAEQLVYDELDTDFYLGLRNSASGRYLFVASFATNISVFRAIDKQNPTAPLILFSVKRDGHDYSVDHAAGRFVIRSNRDGKYALWTATEMAPSEAHWQRFQSKVALPEAENVTVFEKYVYLSGHADAQQRAYIVRLEDGSARELPRQDAMTVYTADQSLNLDPKATKIRFRSGSLIQPLNTYEMDLATGKTQALTNVTLPGYRPSDFAVTRVDFPSTDGVKVPAYLVKKKSLANQATPAVVYAYGHYGISILKEFFYQAEHNNEYITYLNRGVAVVIGMPRGAGDLGTDWAMAGHFEKKRKTVEDTIAILRGLAAQGYSSPGKMVFKGHSAGGINAGGVINEAPDSVRAVVASAPFVDVLNTMSDASIPLTTQEWKVWGNPVESSVDYFRIKSWSPYDNVKRQAQPAVYAFASLHDSQVPYWEPLKLVTKLQNNQTGTAPILVRLFLTGSHTGGAGEAAFDAFAEERAFVLKQLGFK